MKIEFIRSNDNLIAQVVALGTKNSKTLGHFPEGAYFDHAKKGFLVCAHADNNLIGYILFSITQSKRSVRIIQLCISDKFRNKGISKMLLDAVKDEFRDSFKGIVLSCRTDYKAASALWERYGFKAMNKVRSRSKKENYLFRWWFDFGNDDLFSSSQSASTKLKAVLDANIIIKLRSDKSDEETGTRFLLEDWLTDAVDYYYAPEIFNEVKRDLIDKRAQKTRIYLSRFQEARFNPDVRNRIFDEINKIISGNSVNDLSDKRQLSECIASDIKYFITTDENILNADSKINELFGVEVLRPIDLILTVDESTNRSDYLSTRIAGVNYNQVNLKSGEISFMVEKFLRGDKGEKKFELRQIFTQTAADVKNCRTRVVNDENKEILAVWICESSGEILSIPLIRTIKSKLSRTLFHQLIYQSINLALQGNQDRIIISDKFIDSLDHETLELMGFENQEDEWIKYCRQDIIHKHELSELENIDKAIDPIRLTEKLKNGSIDFAVSVERKFWPLKFIDLSIPTFIVPIKPFWASQLFDHYAASNSMFGANATLLWNRENVYYRNVKPVSEEAPARLLWYSSSSKDKNAIRTNSIVGCSYLDEVKIESCKKLFKLFRHYGVYEWKHIYHLAKRDTENLIKALRFSDTEVFSNPISFNKVTNILKSHGRKKNTFTAPLEVTNDIFVEIYKLGINKQK